MADYLTLTNADLLLIARNNLRGVESDYYTASNSSRGYNAQYVATLAVDRDFWADEVTRLEALVASDEETALALAEEVERQEITEADVAPASSVLTPEE